MALDDGSSEDFALSVSPDKKATAGQRRAGRSSSAGGTKRGRTSSEPGRPPRGLGQPESPWPDDKRAVHRRVKIDADAPINTSIGTIVKQLVADREHMAMLKEACEGLYKAQLATSRDLTLAMQRLDKAELVADQRAQIYKIDFGKLQAGVPKAIDAKLLLADIPSVIDARIAASEVQRGVHDMGVRQFLEKLELQDRPAEGVTLIETFRALYLDLADLKSKLGRYEVETESKINAAQGPATRGITVEQDAALMKLFDDVQALKQKNVTYEAFVCEQRRMTHVEVQTAHLLDKLGSVERAATAAAEAAAAAAAAASGATGLVGEPVPENPFDTRAASRAFNRRNGPPGMGAQDDGGDGAPGRTAAAAGPRQTSCHCEHVTRLDARVAVLETRRPDAAGAGGAHAAGSRIPLIPGLRPDAPVFTPADGDDGTFDPTRLIKFRGLGQVAGLRYADKSLYDDKISERTDMRFDGAKGGVAWKSAMEMYLSGKCPIVLELLK